MIRESLPVTFPLILKQESVEKNHKIGRSRGSGIWRCLGDAGMQGAGRGGEESGAASERSLRAKMITNEMPEGLDGGKALIVASRWRIALELHRLGVE